MKQCWKNNAGKIMLDSYEFFCDTLHMINLIRHLAFTDSLYVITIWSK